MSRSGSSGSVGSHRNRLRSKENNEARKEVIKHDVSKGEKGISLGRRQSSTVERSTERLTGAALVEHNAAKGERSLSVANARINSLSTAPAIRIVRKITEGEADKLTPDEKELLKSVRKRIEEIADKYTNLENKKSELEKNIKAGIKSVLQLLDEIGVDNEGSQELTKKIETGEDTWEKEKAPFYRELLLGIELFKRFSGIGRDKRITYGAIGRTDAIDLPPGKHGADVNILELDGKKIVGGESVHSKYVTSASSNLDAVIADHISFANEQHQGAHGEQPILTEDGQPVKRVVDVVLDIPGRRGILNESQLKKYIEDAGDLDAIDEIRIKDPHQNVESIFTKDENGQFVGKKRDLSEEEIKLILPEKQTFTKPEGGESTTLKKATEEFNSEYLTKRHDVDAELEALNESAAKINKKVFPDNEEESKYVFDF